MTILFPTTTSAPHTTKSTFTRITDGEAQGASVLSGSTTDYFLASSGTGTATMGGTTFLGQIGFARKYNSAITQWFVQKGTSFNDGATYRNGFSSTANVSLYMNGTTGTMTSPSGATVTFYYPGVSAVSVDGSPVSGTDGTNSYAVAIAAGDHTISLTAGDVEVQATSGGAVRGPIRVKGGIRFK